MAAVAQLVRVLDCDSRCRGFKSHQPPHQPREAGFFLGRLMGASAPIAGSTGPCSRGIAAEAPMNHKSLRPRFGGRRARERPQAGSGLRGRYAVASAFLASVLRPLQLSGAGRPPRIARSACSHSLRSWTRSLPAHYVHRAGASMPDEGRHRLRAAGTEVPSAAPPRVVRKLEGDAWAGMAIWLPKTRQHEIGIEISLTASA